MDIAVFKEECNRWGARGNPFLFVIDYEMTDLQLVPLNEASMNGIYYDVNGMTNAGRLDPGRLDGFNFNIDPVPFPEYLQAYQLVQKHIRHGDTFLLNLTFPTKLDTDLTLDKIFFGSRAPYKMLYKDRYVVFSPECFIRIEDNRIFSFPMKGTIDASVPDAEKKLIENVKEQQEHNTIVDLIRNDLSMVAKNVKVDRFRYIDRVKAFNRELLQVSSEISGDLPTGWKKDVGNILATLVPAGSISGAPKPSTLDIIQSAEGQPRGYFTGIFGIFDGKRVDCAVMIRYIERTANGLQFRSGGGITYNSDPIEEYDEMIGKVYVPIV